ncbi:MAG: zinc-dependent alcohol dehydrogenase [Bacillota bacterium]
MKAAVMLKPNVLSIQEVPVPDVEDDEVLIEVHASGLCGSDLHIFRGHRSDVTFPHISGHEASGKVAKVGAKVTRVKVGDRVAVEPNFGCGVCEICRRGTTNLCFSKKTLGLNLPGCFAEYVKAPERYVWPIPDTMSYLEGALVEPATVAVHAVNHADIEIGDKVLVLGAGPIGLLILQCAKLAGGEVTVVDVAKPRLEIAKELGADRVSDGRDLAARAFDRVIDAAGVSATLNLGLKSLKPGGTLVLVGLGGEPLTFDGMVLVRQEIKLKGIVACSDEFPRTIELVAKGKINVKALANYTLKLEEVEQGLKLMEDKVAIKPVIFI